MAPGPPHSFQPEHCSSTTKAPRHQGEAAQECCPPEDRAFRNLLHRPVRFSPLEVLAPGGRWCLGVFVVKCLGSRQLFPSAEDSGQPVREAMERVLVGIVPEVPRYDADFWRCGSQTVGETLWLSP